MDEIQTKVLRVFLLAIHSHLYSFAFRFLLLQAHATSYNFYSSVTVKGGKPDRKPNPRRYGLRKPCRNLKIENSQDYAQKPQQIWTFRNSDSGKCVRVPLSNKSGIRRPVLNTYAFRPQKCNSTYFLAGNFLTCSFELLTNFENSFSNPLQRP